MEYDAVGRQTIVSKDGVKLTESTYDTAANGKGLPATSTRWIDGQPYVTKFSGYDLGARVIRTEVVIPETEQGLAGTYVTNVRYGPDGSLLSRGLPAIGTMPAETILQSYDDLGRLQTTTSGLNVQTGYVSQSLYSVYGELERLQFGTTGKRAWKSFYYDDNTRRLTRAIVDTETPQPMQTDVNYTYNAIGRITSIVDKPAGWSVDTQCFRYDGLARLTEAWTPANGCAEEPSTAKLSGPAPYWQSFQYDKVGNRLSDTQHAAGGDTVRTYAYPGMGHRQLSATTTKPGVAASTVEEFGYDEIGNTVRRGGQKLDWNAEGQLAKVTEQDKATEFVYNAAGNRLIRRDPAGTTLYLGGQEIRVDKATGAKTVTRYYAHGGKTVAVRVGDVLSWLAANHQSTNQVAVDTSSLQVSKRRQLPFGAPRGPDAPFPGEQGFVGGTTDSSIGLTTLGFRQYDSASGRFMSVDPIMDPLDSQQMHGYSYSNNNPISASDPSGLRLEWDEPWCGVKACKEPNHNTAPPVESQLPRTHDYGGNWWSVTDRKTNDVWLNGVKLPWSPGAAMVMIPKVKRAFGGNIVTPVGTEDNIEDTVGALIAFCRDDDNGCSWEVYEHFLREGLRVHAEIGSLADGGGRGGSTRMSKATKRYMDMLDEDFPPGQLRVSQSQRHR